MRPKPRNRKESISPLPHWCVVIIPTPSSGSSLVNNTLRVKSFQPYILYGLAWAVVSWPELPHFAGYS